MICTKEKLLIKPSGTSYIASKMAHCLKKKYVNIFKRGNNKKYPFERKFSDSFKVFFCHWTEFSFRGSKEPCFKNKLSGEVKSIQ